MSRSRVVGLILALQVVSLLGCGIGQDHPSPIFGYRLLDDRTLSVLASTGAGYETWVESVVETATSVVVDVRYRVSQLGGDGDVAHDLWLTVPLRAPLGDRTVLDAINETPIEALP
jgi:hypothetical protein